MSGDKAREILDALKTGVFLLSVHCAERMAERSVTKADIRACGRTAHRCMRQAQGTYRIEGFDLDGEPLTVICSADVAVLVVRIF
jgi:hypothetical protein